MAMYLRACSDYCALTRQSINTITYTYITTCFHSLTFPNEQVNDNIYITQFCIIICRNVLHKIHNQPGAPMYCRLNLPLTTW